MQEKEFFKNIFTELSKEADLQDISIDSTFVIVHRSALGAKTKIHALVDALGYPIRLLLSAGNVNDITVAPKLIKSCGVKSMNITRAKINWRAAFCRLFTLQVF